MKAARQTVVAVVLSVLGGFAAGAEYYVAPEGDDPTVFCLDNVAFGQ